jgi:hypothetical protein
MKLNNINTPRQSSETQTIRNFKKYSKTKFKINLSYERWENIFCENDANIIFSNFLNSYLRVFYSSFTKREIHIKPKGNTWMTTGIKTLCIHKRDLFLLCRKSNDTQLREHYKLYGKTLTWKNNIDQLKSKLSSACHAVRNVKAIMSQETLRMIYFPYLRSIMTYGIIFFGGGGN